MKHQIQELKKFNIPCVESVIREKLESKSGLLHFKSKKNSTKSPSNSTTQHHNSTSVKSSHQQKPLLGIDDDESVYSRAGHKKHEHIHPSAQPQVTQVIQNIILHHDDNRFMKSVDLTGTGKSNIAQNEDYDRFVVNQQPVLQNTNYYQENGNLQNDYGAYNNPYSMYWKKKN